jgi:hypothetical protein
MANEDHVHTLFNAVNAQGMISLHVYKAPGIWNKDDIITGDDKMTVLYHLVFPRTWLGDWELILRQGGPSGPEICRIVKSAFGSEMLVIMPNGWKTPLVRGKLFSSSHEYIGFDGKTTWKWKTSAVGRDITVSAHNLWHSDSSPS